MANNKAPKAPNYTPAQEQLIRDRSASVGTLDATSAAALATELGKTPRSVIAKINRLGLPYATKTPVTKTGEPVASKTAIVADIAAIVGANLDGLEKAPKAVLYSLRTFAQAFADDAG